MKVVREFISKYIWAAYAGVVIALLIALLAQAGTLAKVRLEFAQHKLKSAEALAEAHEALNGLTTGHAAKQQEIADNAHETDKARFAAAAAAAAAGHSMRGAVKSYTAGRRDDASACQREADRARNAGEVLVDADRLAEQLAGAAEQHNDEVRILRRQLDIDREFCEAALAIRM